MATSVGPSGRRKRANEYPILGNAATSPFALPTSSNVDAISAIVVPSDCWVGHSVAHCSSGGTGTSSDVTLVWRSAATGGGSAASGPHVQAGGVLIDIDTAGGLDFAAEPTYLPANGITEGGRLFLNSTFTGTVTAGGSWELSMFLIL